MTVPVFGPPVQAALQLSPRVVVVVPPPVVVVPVQGAPVLVHVPLQLSRPDVVSPQAGAEALQLPSGVHPQLPPVLKQVFPQLSLP